MDQDYSKLKYLDLKKLCRERDLESVGKKVELIKRLEEDDEKYKLEDGEMFIFVKTLFGSVYTFRMLKEQTIMDLKKEISSKLNYKIEKIRLHSHQFDANGQLTTVPTDDNKNFVEQGIYNESTLLLHLRF